MSRLSDQLGDDLGQTLMDNHGRARQRGLRIRAGPCGLYVAWGSRGRRFDFGRPDRNEALTSGYPGQGFDFLR